MTDFRSMTRREFAVPVLASLVAAATGARAQEQTLGGQAEWKQSYDGATSLKVDRSVTPVLSPLTLQATEQMVGVYQQLVAQGGWPMMQNQTMKLGSKGPNVVALRRRLVASGDLDPAVGASQIYDSFVEGGVKRFQTRHGLIPTGQLNALTINAMNVPAEVRLRQLETNVVRLRSYAGNLGQRFVVANIPAALVETVEDGQVVTRHAAGVGKIDRQSPVLTTRVVDINFNPFWTVPASIIRKDLIPKMQADPNYLTDNKIRIFKNQSEELRPEQVNWRSDEATRYMFRQDPGGEFNSLGFVRINIPNPHGVYMHDTPSKGIFGDDFRFVSSGCMRVQNVRDYVTWLLKDTPGWSREAIDAAIQSGQRVDAKLAQPVPVYWVYITAWATPDGLVQFREDIYNKDGLGPMPVASVQKAVDEDE
ncbi:L,D-transpeptidase family protein [Alsobacter sp. SYSU M60028]|uniref:L,D-transpeptidase family protein n=1 Tax=Alsobacter ponti TaxID=2962936 RepID=A0ABT1LA63_9HYPH|nr:L,D-transpeptidase family protein [Alsobacter ponti]MCP8938359.1 L,D-transpeptidase family protein [Alsobacter ponti]